MGGKNHSLLVSKGKGTVGSGAAIGKRPARSNATFSSTITLDSVAKLMDEHEEICTKLFPHLPSDRPKSKYEVECTVRSPQFQQVG